MFRISDNSSVSTSSRYHAPSRDINLRFLVVVAGARAHLLLRPGCEWVQEQAQDHDYELSRHLLHIMATCEHFVPARFAVRVETRG